MMRWGSHGYKIGINESTACPAAFSISIMNLGAHRPATDEANETLAACGAHEGRRRDVVQLASRADVERSHGDRTFVTRRSSVLRTIYLRRVISDLYGEGAAGRR